MVASTHIKHETKVGRLDITLMWADECTDEKNSRVQGSIPPIPGGCAIDEHILKLVFEDAETGAFFDGAFTHDELCAICPIFHMIDEIPELLAEMPTIALSESTRAGREVGFKYTGKKREYLIILPMKAREYAPETRDVVELRAENSVLRKRVAALEEQVARHDKMCKQFQKDISHIGMYLLQQHAGESNRVKQMCQYIDMIRDDDSIFPILPGGSIMSLFVDHIENRPVLEAISRKGMGFLFIPTIISIIANYGTRNQNTCDNMKLLIDGLPDVNIADSNKKTILATLDKKIDELQVKINTHAQYPASLPPMMKEMEEYTKFRKYLVKKGAR